jgi:hypothetical protein
LSLRFLITGFDKYGKGHILVAGGDEPPTDYTQLGFFAIGSGANAALSSLLFHKSRKRMSSEMSEGVCAYLLCEAKFMSEPGDVGRATFVALMEPPKDQNNIEPKFVTDVDAIREIWEAEGAPCLPNSTNARISKLIRSSTDIEESRNKRREEKDRAEQSLNRLDPDIRKAIETLAVAAETGKLEIKETRLPHGKVNVAFKKLNPKKRSEQE